MKLSPALSELMQQASSEPWLYPIRWKFTGFCFRENSQHSRMNRSPGWMIKSIYSGPFISNVDESNDTDLLFPVSMFPFSRATFDNHRFTPRNILVKIDRWKVTYYRARKHFIFLPYKNCLTQPCIFSQTLSVWRKFAQFVGPTYFALCHSSLVFLVWKSWYRLPRATRTSHESLHYLRPCNPTCFPRFRSKPFS